MRGTLLLTLFLVTSTLCLNLGEFASDKLPHPYPPHNLDQGQGSFPVGCCCCCCCCWCCCCCCCCPALSLLLTFVFYPCLQTINFLGRFLVGISASNMPLFIPTQIFLQNILQKFTSRRLKKHRSHSNNHLSFSRKNKISTLGLRIVRLWCNA